VSTISPISDPSPAELLARVRTKISEPNFVLCPTVSKQIVTLKQTVQVEAQNRGDEDYRVVYQPHLEDALMKGSIVDKMEVGTPPHGWALTIEGIDSNGDKLTVMVELSKNPSEPLAITDFTIPQP